MFQSRQEAAQQIAERVRAHGLQDPVVVAIPRGGVVLGAVLARELHAEFDVVLCQRLRAPWDPHATIGAIHENGTYYLNREPADVPGLSEDFVDEEVRLRSAELRERVAHCRQIRPCVSLTGRSVIVIDDGIMTGATMIAALRGLQGQRPFEVIVAVPIATVEEIARVRCWCDEVICLETVSQLDHISQSYVEFPLVEDAEVIKLLCEMMPKQSPTERSRAHGPVRMPANHLRD